MSPCEVSGSALGFPKTLECRRASNGTCTDTLGNMQMLGAMGIRRRYRQLLGCQKTSVKPLLPGSSTSSPAPSSRHADAVRDEVQRRHARCEAVYRIHGSTCFRWTDRFCTTSTSPARRARMAESSSTS